MIPIYTLVLFLLTLINLTDTASYKPPMIDESVFRTRNIYYKEEESIEIPCAAEGHPTPVYSWIKDGEELDLESEEVNGRMSLISGVGTLRIKPAHGSDEGVYQCQARNAHGTSLSVRVNVLQARMDPFKTVEDPEILRPLLAHSLKLSCGPPVSVPPAKISWIIDQKVDEGDYDTDYESENQDLFDFVDLDDRVTMDYAGNLYITNVKPEDAQDGNKYVCFSNNEQLRSFGKGEDKIIEPLGNTAKMRDSNMPVEMLWHSDTDVMGLVGKTVRFKCIFSGNPQPRITWKRMEGLAFDNNRMKQSSEKFEFVIKKVQYGDAGEYECSGFNGITRNPIRHRFRLIVEAKPRWTKKPQDIEAGVKEDATFLCEGKGSPEPKVQWFINGKPIEQAANITRRTYRKGQLTFTDLQKMDSQVIQCNVSNKHGFLWADVYLNVLAIPAAVKAGPEPLLKVAEEKSVTIKCQTAGKPTPVVTWFKGDQPLSGGRYKILPIGDLVIAGVRKKDSGNYRCFARNLFGKDQANGTLVVREKTRISQEPNNVQSVNGNDAVFRCRAFTDPNEQHRLRYTWLRNGQPLIIDNDRVIQQSEELIIKDSMSQDTGNYTCIASNGLDEDRAWATLKVKAPPDPPTNVTLLECLARQATIIWVFDQSQDNFSPLQNFIMEYNTSYAPDHWKVASRPNANARRAEVELSPFAHYNFRVRAVNRIGKGEPSVHNQLICQTPVARPDHHPEGVKTVGDKTNYLVVEWEPMEEIDLNADGFYYNVTVQREGEDTVDSYIIDDFTVSRKEIPVDTVYKPYIVTVQAKNQVGEPLKNADSIIGYSGQARPLVAPENFELDPEKNVTATSAGFQWDPVNDDPDVIQGVFKGYKIRIWKKDQRESTTKEIFIPHTPNADGTRQRRQTQKIKAEVPNLASYSDLEADVVTTNEFFTSVNGSNIVNFSTPEGVPSKVRYFEAVNVGSTHFTLHWGEPKEKNGIITGYDLGYQRVNGIMYEETKIAEKVDSRTRRTYLGGLEPGTNYRLYLWGRTQQGRGAAYFIDVKTAEKGIPLAKPRILEILPRPDSANVTWELPHVKGQRVGAKYFIDYRKYGLDSWNTHPEHATMNTWQVLENLESGMTYEIRIVAKSGQKGDADFAQMASEKRTFKTGGVGMNTSKPTAPTSIVYSINYKPWFVGYLAASSSILSAGWFIGMMVAIAILLLILIIVCIVKRNRGDKYHVQEKERLRGSNPEDVENFNELNKSDTNGIGQSNSFDNNPEKMPLGDETDSMEEYGDVDPAKFNEDGSFIGEYGGQKGVGDQQASTMATLV
ncbi:hypothetical protein LOTGIDRAFT_174928 [Lottia gigantea]|uniref:Neuroglian n=1 Tax=Lottia gigantea TaxID=225164 RepID=V4ARB0_LOTGI|nr:hypothetical protein LOTGIDRAFT_174928 [Lottia gigantea]ESO96246.1 hypothetical protein LOTGIDRAFT_174928 [Lottia gigantea]